MAQTFAPTATYGSNAVKNRVRFGGALGSNQYFYKTNAKTGTVEINRYEQDTSSGRVTETSIGNIPQGGKFIPNSNASGAELTHYNNPKNVGKARAQALQVARREWDGKTQPPPQQAIYGTVSGNAPYTPPAAKTVDESIKGVQNTGYSNAGGSARSNRNLFNDVAQGALQGGVQAGLNNLTADGLSGGLGGLIGGALGGGIGGSSGRSRGVTVYPVTLRRTGNAQDYLQFDMLKYEPKKKTGYSWGKRSKDRTPIETIVLPIPGGIQDTNAVSWGGDKMDPAQTAMANLALSGIQGGGAGFEATAKEIGNQIQNNKEEVKSGLSNAIAGMASGTGAQLLTRTTGQVLNPNMELLFKEPSLRPFNFTWKLSARNEDEANAIIKLIRIFKQGMAPQTEGENLFLKSPHTWKLTYMHKGSPHPYLNQFKECAMNSLSTQYTPDGTYATFETGHMTAYSITMGLQELEPVFSSDYIGVKGLGY